MGGVKPLSRRAARRLSLRGRDPIVTLFIDSLLRGEDFSLPQTPHLNLRAAPKNRMADDQQPLHHSYFAGGKSVVARVGAFDLSPYGHVVNLSESCRGGACCLGHIKLRKVHENGNFKKFPGISKKGNFCRNSLSTTVKQPREQKGSPRTSTCKCGAVSRVIIQN